jgi:hypothetical protein
MKSWKFLFPHSFSNAISYYSTTYCPNQWRPTSLALCVSAAFHKNSVGHKTNSPIASPTFVIRREFKNHTFKKYVFVTVALYYNQGQCPLQIGTPCSDPPATLITIASATTFSSSPIPSLSTAQYLSGKIQGALSPPPF